MANRYANIARTGTSNDLLVCFDLITAQPAKLMNLSDYGIAVGNRADLIILGCDDATMAVAEVSQPLLGRP